MITLHPPYVASGEIDDLPDEIREWEPVHTLTDRSDDGLGLIRRTVDEAPRWLRRRGWLLMEVDPDRARDVMPIYRRGGFRDVESTKGGSLKVTRVIVGGGRVERTDGRAVRDVALADQRRDARRGRRVAEPRVARGRSGRTGSRVARRRAVGRWSSGRRPAARPVDVTPRGLQRPDQGARVRRRLVRRASRRRLRLELRRSAPLPAGSRATADADHAGDRTGASPLCGRARVAGRRSVALRPRAPRGRRRRERARVASPTDGSRRRVDRRGRPRLLLDAAHLAGRHEAGVADVGSAVHAVGRLRAVGRGSRSRRRRVRRAPRRRVGRRRSRSSSRSGARTVCCTSSRTGPAGGTCIARSTARCAPSVRWTRSSAGRSGCSGCRRTRSSTTVGSRASGHSDGTQHVSVIDPRTGELLDLDLPYDAIDFPFIAAEGQTIAFVGGSADTPPQVVVLDFLARSVDVLKESDTITVAPGVPVGSPSDRVPDGRRSHRARVLLRAGQQGLHRAARRAAAADRDEPRRSHVGRHPPSSTCRCGTGPAAGSPSST